MGFDAGAYAKQISVTFDPSMLQIWGWSVNANGSVWLGLCTYTPFLEMTEEPECGIVNVRTGQTIQPKSYEQNDCKLLSKRQVEILSLLAKGMGSKQIADKLYLSVHTVNRHCQDILSALRVTNAAAAVKIGLHLHLI